MQALEVLAGKRPWSVDVGDCLPWLRSLPDDSVDLLLTSPPYEDCRSYEGLGTSLRGDAWVAWMLEVIRAAAPKVKGLIAVVCEGKTRHFAYSATPFLLVSALFREGFNLRKPLVYHRVGIPGSGGPDWLRNDWEPVVCVSRPGRLPWSDNTAMGHEPKYRLGGPLSHRTRDDTRVDGKRRRFGHDAAGRTKGGHARNICERANPGNVIQAGLTAAAEVSDLIHCTVGGGLMGHPLASLNEAPFPLDLAEFVVRSFAPPGGVVADPFVGSGTTMHAAVANGRRGIACDLRQSQADLTGRRLGLFNNTPEGGGDGQAMG